jgi:hypothetical protein
LNDDSGQTIVEEIFPSSRHLLVSGGYYSASDYQYFWVIKLTKPFTAENFGHHAYQLAIQYPNGSIATYQATPR